MHLMTPKRRTILTILKTTALTSRKRESSNSERWDKPKQRSTLRNRTSLNDSTIKQKQANQSSNNSNSTNVKAKTNSSKKLALKHNKKAVRTNSNMVPGSKTSPEATIEKLRLANSALGSNSKVRTRSYASIKNSHSKQFLSPQTNR